MKIMCWAALHYRLQVLCALNCCEISMKPLVHLYSSLNCVGFTLAMPAPFLNTGSLIKGHQGNSSFFCLHGNIYQPVLHSASQKVLNHFQTLSTCWMPDSSVLRIIMFLYKKENEFFSLSFTTTLVVAFIFLELLR